MPAVYQQFNKSFEILRNTRFAGVVELEIQSKWYIYQKIIKNREDCHVKEKGYNSSFAAGFCF